MAARIVHFGLDENAIVSTFANHGYEVDECGISVLKLNNAVQRGKSDAVAIEESAASPNEETITAARSLSQVPFILFRDAIGRYDPSIFDLVIAERTPTNDWLRRVAELIERSRIIRAETKAASERLHSLMRESAALIEATVTVRLESQIALARLTPSGMQPVRIGSVLIVDDYAPWREKIRSTLRDCAELQSITETADGIEAVQQASALKPDLILLDLRLPMLNGIEAARQIREVAPHTTILFVSMEKNAEIVREALMTGAKGYVLKTDAGTELWPAIQSVLQNKQYLSRGVRLDGAA